MSEQDSSSSVEQTSRQSTISSSSSSASATTAKIITSIAATSSAVTTLCKIGVTIEPPPVGPSTSRLRTIPRPFTSTYTSPSCGWIKWFDPVKGYGFIRAIDRVEDIFVHKSSFREVNLNAVDADQPVMFRIRFTLRGPSAYDVRLVGSTKFSEISSTDYSTFPFQRKRFRTRRARCYNCGRYTTHEAATCPIEPRQKCCYRCHLPDHLISDCPFSAQHGTEQVVEEYGSIKVDNDNAE